MELTLSTGECVLDAVDQTVSPQLPMTSAH